MLHLLVNLENEIKKDDHHLYHHTHHYIDYYTTTYNSENVANEEIFEHYQIIHLQCYSSVCYGWETISPNFFIFPDFPFCRPLTLQR